MAFPPPMPVNMETSHQTVLADLANIPTAAVVFHPKEGLLDANPAGALLLDAANGERALVLEALAQVAIGSQVDRTERVIRYVDDAGVERMVRARGAALTGVKEAALILLDELEDHTALEQTLAQSERLYDTFLTQAPTGIVHLDARGNVTFENDQLRQMLDTKDNWSIDDVGFDTGTESAIAKLVEHGVAFSLSRVRCRVEVERPRILYVTGSPIRDHEGELVGSVLMLLDQTEVFEQEQAIEIRNRYKSAEVSLRRAATEEPDEQRFLERAAQVLARAIGVDEVAIVVANPHDDEFRVRAAWPDLSAVDGSGDKSADAADAVSSLLESDADDVFWTPFLVGDDVGGFVSYRDRRALTPAERSQVLGHTDELVRVFERQWSAVQTGYRYRLAVESIDDGLFSYVLRPDGRRVYLFATRQFEGLFGIDVRDVVGGGETARWFEAGLDEVGRTAIENHHSALQAGLASRTVFRFEHPQGQVRWLREDATAQRDAQGQLSVTGIVVDISEQKEAEELIEKARRAAESEARRKTSFIATMSHELRTPLGTVHGFAEMMRRDLEEAPADNPLSGLAEFAGAIEERSGELLTVVEDLLDLSNLESGLLALSRAPVDLSALAGDLCRRHQRLADDSGLALVLEADEGALALGDQARIAKILDRIMANAIKFTDAGTITVNARRIEGHAVVEITDEGVGMDEAQLAQIFEAFVQGDDRLNRSFEGAGLGLTVAHRLATAMGGSIEAESSPGHGTTIRLVLPDPES